MTVELLALIIAAVLVIVLANSLATRTGVAGPLIPRWGLSRCRRS